MTTATIEDGNKISMLGAFEFGPTPRCRALKIAVPFAVKLRDGFEMYGREGDYLCDNPAGDRWIIAGAEFESLHSEATFVEHARGGSKVEYVAHPVRCSECLVLDTVEDSPEGLDDGWRRVACALTNLRERMAWLGDRGASRVTALALTKVEEALLWLTKREDQAPKRPGC